MTDLAQFSVLEESQYQGISIVLGQGLHGLVENWGDLVPVQFGGSVKVLHEGGLAFALIASARRAGMIRSEVTGVTVQPAGDWDLLGNLPCFLGEIAEDGLGDIACGIGIAGQLAAGGGKHQVHVAPDQLRKGSFVLPCRVGPEQFIGIKIVAHLPDRNR